LRKVKETCITPLLLFYRSVSFWGAVSFDALAKAQTAACFYVVLYPAVNDEAQLSPSPVFLSGDNGLSEDLLNKES